MKKRAIVVMVCAIGFVASFVIIGYFGLTSTGMMERMYVSQSKQLVIGKEENGSWKAVLPDPLGRNWNVYLIRARQSWYHMLTYEKFQFVWMPSN